MLVTENNYYFHFQENVKQKTHMHWKGRQNQEHKMKFQINQRTLFIQLIYSCFSRYHVPAQDRMVLTNNIAPTSSIIYRFSQG